jgi:hypothetical protein
MPYDFYSTAMSPQPEPPALLIADEFLSEARLSALLAGGDAVASGALLRTADGRRWMLREAVRVLGLHGQDNDPYGITGTADTLRSLLARGFVMSSERIALGRRVYDVEYGYLPQPLSDPDASGVNPVARG